MNFYQGSYFPPNFKYVGYIGLVSGVVLTLIGNLIAGPPVLLVALGLSFTRVGCKVDVSDKTITNFTSILGLLIGKPEKYTELENLLIKPVEISQVLNSRGSSTTLRYTIYNAYLFYDGQSVLLTGDKNKEKITVQMEQISKELGVPLEIV
jgi:hypothetical protein